MDISTWKIIQLILNTFTPEYFVYEWNQNFLNNVLAMHEDLRLSKKGPLRFFTAGLQEVPPPFLYFLKKLTSSLGFNLYRAKTIFLFFGERKIDKIVQLEWAIKEFWFYLSNFVFCL